MALKIYETTTPTSNFSESGTFTNPLSVSLNGTTGETIEQRLYLRNTESDRYYQNIVIQPVDSGDGIIDGTNGYSWKLIAGDERPLEEQWALVSDGNSISMNNIGSASTGDTTTYLPFWLRIQIPRGAPVKSFQGVSLNISYTETII